MKKILLVCNAGMSSSILVKKIKQAAVTRDIEVEVQAKSLSELSELTEVWDVCLAGPQIIYAVENIKDTLGIPVEPISPQVYALADGEKALDQALHLLESKKGE